MIVKTCQPCEKKGVNPDDLLLVMKTDDGVWLCGLCEQRIKADTTFEVQVRVERAFRDVYAVLPLIDPFLEMLSEQNRRLTLAFYNQES